MSLRRIILLCVSFVIVALTLLSVFFISQMFTQPIGSAQENKTVTLPEGSSVRNIASSLHDAGVIQNEWMFLAYVWFTGEYRNIRAGEYTIPGSFTSVQVIQTLLAGKGDSREFEARFIEGWTSQQMAGYLREQNFPDWGLFLSASQVNDTRKIVPDRTFSFLGDKPDDASLEGYLFPDTYRIFRDASGADVVVKMLDNFDRKVTPEFREEIARQGWTVFQVVTLASIVEREGRSVEDRRKIAHVFLKRLKIDMPLQSDATVNFVTGKDRLQPTFEDVKTPSLYNTYLYKGLPPGPISNPGLESIHAAVYPEENDYYYFLTKPDGEAVFSVTGEEHEQKKKLYLP